MTYHEATAYLNKLIDYEKQPSFQYDAAFKLDRVVALMRELGNPERGWPALHVAGTKAKGSVAAYLDALLRAHDHRTGSNRGRRGGRRNTTRTGSPSSTC